MIVRIPDIQPASTAWADTAGVDRWGMFAGVIVDDVTHLFRWIEPGEFLMGSPDDEFGRWEAEGPQHRVEIKNGFWIGQTPVTQEFYQAVAGKNPSGIQGKPRHPVEQVNWDDAVAFCDELNQVLGEDAVTARLPSEAEWEYACRAGTRSALHNGQPLTSERGQCPNLDEVAWYLKNSENTTHPVGEKSPNAWGLYDMVGNVWEWCQDGWHGNYNGVPTDGSAWDGEDGIRVFRGGSWANRARYCRCASRDRWLSGNRISYSGFRLVLSSSSSEDSPFS